MAVWQGGGNTDSYGGGGNTDGGDGTNQARASPFDLLMNVSRTERLVPTKCPADGSLLCLMVNTPRSRYIACCSGVRLERVLPMLHRTSTVVCPAACQATPLPRAERLGPPLSRWAWALILRV